MLAPSRTLLVGTIISQADAHGLGMPSKANGGTSWQLFRAGLPYSLAHELMILTEFGHVTLASRCLEILARCNRESLPSGELRRPPPQAHFERAVGAEPPNPADVVALGHVAKLVSTSRTPVSMPDAVKLYVAVRCVMLEHVQEHIYATLKVPAGSAPRQLQIVRETIRDKLPVMAFPYNFPHAAVGAGTWCYALLPDVPSVPDSEATRTIELWYRMLLIDQRVHDGLSDEQMQISNSLLRFARVESGHAARI